MRLQRLEIALKKPTPEICRTTSRRCSYGYHFSEYIRYLNGPFSAARPIFAGKDSFCSIWCSRAAAAPGPDADARLAALLAAELAWYCRLRRSSHSCGRVMKPEHRA